MMKELMQEVNRIREEQQVFIEEIRELKGKTGEGNVVGKK